MALYYLDKQRKHNEKLDKLRKNSKNCDENKSPKELDCSKMIKKEKHDIKKEC